MSKPLLIAVLLPLFFCALAGAEPNAYVVNEGSGSVSVIDTKTDEVTATIKVGERPRGLAVTITGERLYVSHDDGTIIERDMYEKETSGVAKVGRQPGSIDLSPGGKLLAAAIRSNDEIVLVDLASMRAMKTIPVRGGTAANAVFSPDGRWIYVTAEQSPEVRVIDVKQGAVTNSIPIGPRLRGIAFLPGGSRAYVAADQESEVVVIDVARHAVLARVKTAGAPFGVTPHPDGKRVFVSAPGAGKVQVLDTSANRIVAEFEACNGASTMAVNPEGHKLYVICGPANQVSVFDSSTYKRIAQVSVGVAPANVVMGEPPLPPDGGERPPRRGSSRAP